MKVIFGINNKYSAKEIPEGSHPPSTRVGAHPTPLGVPPALWAPWQASGVHLWLYELFCPGKNKKEACGAKRRRLEAEPGETNLGLRRSCSVGETSL